MLQLLFLLLQVLQAKQEIQLLLHASKFVVGIVGLASPCNPIRIHAALPSHSQIVEHESADAPKILQQTRYVYRSDEVLVLLLLPLLLKILLLLLGTRQGDKLHLNG